MTPIPIAAGVVVAVPAAANPAAPPPKAHLLAALFAPWLLCVIGMATPILKATYSLGTTQVYFFKTCHDLDLGLLGKMSSCETGNPGGKGATAMYCALGFAVIHGINILMQMCTYRKKCCFFTTGIGCGLLPWSFIFVALFKTDLEKPGLGTQLGLGYDYGGGFFALVIGSLLCIGTYVFLHKKG